MKTVLKDLTIDEVYNFIKVIGEEKYRATQLLSWLYKKNAQYFSEMTNIPKSLREKFSEETELKLFKNTESLKSSDESIKFKFTLKDGEKIGQLL